MLFILLAICAVGFFLWGRGSMLFILLVICSAGFLWGEGVYVAHLVSFLCCVFRFVCLRSVYFAQCFLCFLIIHSFL
jgi:hypothetical protein